MLAKLETGVIVGLLCLIAGTRLIAGTANAEPLLIPCEPGTIWEFNKYIESDPGTIIGTRQMKFLQEVTMGSENKSYIHV